MWDFQSHGTMVGMVESLPGAIIIKKMEKLKIKGHEFSAFIVKDYS